MNNLIILLGTKPSANSTQLNSVTKYIFSKFVNSFKEQFEKHTIDSNYLNIKPLQCQTLTHLYYSMMQISEYY
ncbi:hypothetical protein pb186bvf_018537 [Paramecium bursaria]